MNQADFAGELYSHGKVEEKIWGHVVHVFHNDLAAISYLRVKSGTYCSTHYHKHRYNQFTVVRGKITVEIFKPNKQVEAAFLVPGQTFIVRPQVAHRFVVIESGVVVETYWCDIGGSKRVSIEDIVRLEPGGTLDA